MSPFPTQGAPMQFERERDPTYVDDDNDAAVVAEQQRVLKAALPIKSLQIVRGAMVDYGAGIASALASAPVEVLVDISAAPELKTMLDAVRQATTPLDIDVFAQWMVTHSTEHWLALLATLLGRAVAMYGLITPLRGEWKVLGAYRPVLVWGGLRGAVSLALVLSIPHTLPNGQAFPNRDLLQLMAFGVVGVSLLLQGLAMPLLIRKIGLMITNGSTNELPVLRARLHAVGDALLALDYEHDQGKFGSLPHERLAQSYRQEHMQR